MAFMIERAHRLIRMAGKTISRVNRKAGGREDRLLSIRIALVNNMPDAALEDTERQFSGLLEAAAGGLPIHISLFSLPEIPRGARGKRRIAEAYSGIEALWNGDFDAVIVTGTEPRQPDLRQEPYWHTFTRIIDWAEENTHSAVLSCLAAHAGVLYRDDIPRHRLIDKQFGVFEYESSDHHFLTKGASTRIRIPHSRWNEVKEDALLASGYVVLTRSSDAGADLFVKRRKRSLFIHFQGHPEYGARTLLKEYRRDVKRFIRRERETFPTMPRGYFDAASAKLLAEFQNKVLSQPHEALLREFPEAAVAEKLENTWRPSAVAVYRNWLRFLASKKMAASESAPLARARHA
jgi:homoserine O-succinyltransferase/O-acetyltransferase